MYTFTDEIVHEHQATLRSEADRDRRAARYHRAQQLRRRASAALTRSREADGRPL